MKCPFRKRTLYSNIMFGTQPALDAAIEEFEDCIGEECTAYRKKEYMFSDMIYYECSLTNSTLYKKSRDSSEEVINKLP